MNLDYLLIGNIRKKIEKKEEKEIEKLFEKINENSGYASFCKIKKKNNVMYKFYLYGTSEKDIMEKQLLIEIKIKKSFDDFKIYKIRENTKKEIFFYP